MKIKLFFPRIRKISKNENFENENNFYRHNDSFYVCAICNQYLYYTNFLPFDITQNDNEFISKQNTKLSSFDSKCYICRTCNSSAKKLKFSC